MMRPSLGYFFLKSQYKRQFEGYLRESFVFFIKAELGRDFKLILLRPLCDWLTLSVPQSLSIRNQ